MSDTRDILRRGLVDLPPDPDAYDHVVRRMERHRRNQRLVAGVVAVAIGVAAIVLMARALPSGETRVPVEQPSLTGDLRLIDIATDEVSSGPELGDDVGHFSVSSDGEMVAYIASSTDGEIVHVANIDGSDARAFPQTRSPDGALSPSWSPDGSTIVYHAKERGRVGNLFLLDVASGGVRQLTDLRSVPTDFWLMTPTFVSGGDAVVFAWPTATGGGDLRGDLWSIPIAGGDPVRIHRTAGWVDASPDGDRITFTEFSIIDDDLVVGDLWIADADGSNSERLIDGLVTMSRLSPDGSHVTYTDEMHDELVILDLTTGEKQPASWAAQGNDWIDERTLLVEP